MRQVYFITGGGATKVGMTGNIESRLSTMQSGNPHRIYLLLLVPGGIAVERAIHTEMRRRYVRMLGEWYEGELTKEEALDVVEKSTQVIGGRGAAEVYDVVTDRPLCDCHDKPMNWARSSRRREGGYWRCLLRRQVQA